jgi:hypothetical protein
MALEDPQPVYRGVILKLYPGIHTRTLKRYTTADGTERLYHEAHAYGPYGSKGPATAQVTSALRDHEMSKKRGHYTTQHVYNPTTRQYDVIQSGSVPEFVGFVEQQIPAWASLDGTFRTD